MFPFLLTIYFWCVTVISLLITSLVCFLSYPFLDRVTFSHLYETLSGYIMFYSMIIPGFWELEIRDLRKKKTWDKRFVVVANHLSFIDSLVLAFLPLKNKKFMISETFVKIPIFGWLCKNAGYISVDKNNRRSRGTAVYRAVRILKKDNSSLCIYPEGKREEIPFLFENFKTGAYRIAKKVKIPILPITILGTEIGMPLGGKVSRTKIVLIIDEPFYIKDKTNYQDYQNYIQKTKEIFKKNL